jgi:hypothetical protein
MEKVLNITGRIEDKKRQEQITSNRNKFDAVQRLLQCGSCRFKCAMCGRQAEEVDASDPENKAPFPSLNCVKAAVPNLKITSKFPKKRENRTIFSGTTGNGLKCGPAGWRTSGPSINSGQSFNIKQLPDNKCTQKPPTGFSDHKPGNGMLFF